MLLKSLLIAFALCVDSLAASTSAALQSHMTWRRGLFLAAVFGLMQGAFPLAGALLGVACERFVSSVDHWIAFGLLALVGGRMIWEAFHASETRKQLDLSSTRMIFLMAVATSIDAFVVGIGFGLNQSVGENLFTAAVIALITFLVSLAGVWLGKRNTPINERAATVIASLVLIALGTHTLAEHLIQQI